MSLIKAIVNKFPTLTFRASCENQIEVSGNFHTTRFTLLPGNMCECECWTSDGHVKFVNKLEKCVDNAHKMLLPEFGFLDAMVWLSDRGVHYTIDVNEDNNTTIIAFDDFTVTYLDDPIFTHLGSQIHKRKFQGMIVNAYGL